MHTKAPNLWHGGLTLHDSQLARWGEEGESSSKERVTTPR
jgi:hypothetical protein